MHHVLLDRWSQGVSPLHSRDPRAKIAVLVVFLIVLATTPVRATLAIAILKGAVACHTGMATFAEAGVSDKPQEDAAPKAAG